MSTVKLKVNNNIIEYTPVFTSALAPKSQLYNIKKTSVQIWGHAYSTLTVMVRFSKQYFCYHVEQIISMKTTTTKTYIFFVLAFSDWKISHMQKHSYNLKYSLTEPRRVMYRCCAHTSALAVTYTPTISLSLSFLYLSLSCLTVYSTLRTTYLFYTTPPDVS